jgi:PAS domain S-box-containing protein
MLLRSPRLSLRPYAITIALFLAALAISLLLRPVVERVPFIFFWPVVIISAWYGGMGPSLLAVVLSVLTVNHFLISSYEGNTVYVADAAALLIFTLLAGLISWLTDVRRRSEEAAYQQRERFSITLNSIGDAVIATDTDSLVTFINPVAVGLTGWAAQEAVGKHIGDIFHIVNEQTRQPVENPIARVLTEGVVTGLANHTVLIAKDGVEKPIDDSGAPIRDSEGHLIGAVLVFRDITERRKAEAALQESEARFRNIADIAPGLIWMAGLDKMCTFFNKQWLDFTGRTMEQELGNGWTEGVHPDDYQRCLDTYVTAFDARQEFTMDYRLRYRDGTYRWIADKGVPRYDSDGTFLGYIGSCIDITERKLTEQKLTEFAAIVNSSDDAIISKSLDGIILSWNPGAERIYGYKAEEMIGKPLARLVPPDQSDELPQIMERLKRGEHIDHYETVRVTHDGRHINVSLSISPIKNAEGQTIAAVKVARDVTERRLAQAAVEASEQRFRLMADTIPGCVWTANEDGTINYVNRYCHDFFGVTEDQSTATDWTSIIHPDNTEYSRQAWMKAVLEGVTYEIEMRNRRADGQYRWLLNRAIPVRDEQGKLTSWFGNAVDVTEIKDAQERTALLQQLTAALSQALTPQQIAEAFVQNVFPALDAHIGAIGFLTEDGTQVEIVNQVGVPEEVMSQYQQIPLDARTPMSDAVRTKQPVWLQSLDEYEAQYPEFPKEVHQRTGTQALVCLPLVVNDRVLGGVGMSFRDRQLFHQENRAFIISVAQQCAQALERARLYQAEQRAHADSERRARRITRLQEITAALSQALTPEEVGNVIVSQGIAALGAAAGSVVRLTDDDTMLELVNSIGYPQDIIEAWHRFPVDTPSAPLGTSVKIMQPIWLGSWEERLALYPMDTERPMTREFEAWAAVPLIVSNQVVGALGLSFATPQAFHEEERKFIVALADQCAQAMERARLYEAEQESRRAAEQTATRIAHLQAVTAALSEARTPSQIAKIVVDEGMTALGALNGAVNLLTDDDTYFEVVYTVNSRLPQDMKQTWQRFPADPSLPVSNVVRTGEAHWFESAEAAIAQFPVLADFTDYYPGAWVMLPLLSADRVHGVLGLIFERNRTFSDEERNFLFALSQQCAQALERARLYEHEIHVAVLEERQRLARDLHDAVSQALFAANVIAQSLPRLYERQPERVSERLVELAQLTQGAAAEMRTLLVELRPEMVINNKLNDLLSQFVMAAKARRRIAITLDVEEDMRPLPVDVHIAIYRVAQETLNNVIKHSQATQATVSLRSHGEQVELRVSDNGRGFDLDQVSPGLGLSSMHERALAVGATLQVSSTVSQGTEVSFIWIVPEASGASA